GEAGLSGVTVTLGGTTTGGQPVNLTTTTDANGNYKFSNLQSGTYTITETQPAGYQDGKDTIGTPGGTTLNDQFTNINLNAAVNGVNNNFAELALSSLAGSVYLDVSSNGFNNGVREAGEA